MMLVWWMVTNVGADLQSHSGALVNTIYFCPSSITVEKIPTFVARWRNIIFFASLELILGQILWDEDFCIAGSTDRGYEKKAQKGLLSSPLLQNSMRMDIQKQHRRSLFDLGEVHVMCPWLCSHPSGHTRLEGAEGYFGRWQELFLFLLLHTVFLQDKGLC